MQYETNTPINNKYTQVRVILPEESGIIVSFEEDGKPGIGSINTSLIALEPKAAFPWHCSITVELRDVSDAGLPLDSERAVINAMEERFIEAVVGTDTTKPNALFLAGLAWDGTYEFLWRIHAPQQVARQLQAMLDGRAYLRPFGYRITPDEEWALAEWHLGVGKGE